MKTLKILLVMMLTMVLILSLGGTNVYATKGEEKDEEKDEEKTGILLTPGEITPTLDEKAETEIKTIGGKVIGLIQGVGVVLTVVILAILGIKYMMGSAEEKAEYKKTMIPYIVGAICIFGSTSIATLVYNISQL